MKKISYIELSGILLSIIISFNCGINLYIIKNNCNVNSWLAITLSYIIGFIPLLLTLYIANYHGELDIIEKNKHLFGNYIGTLINTFIALILLFIAATLLYNIITFISHEFLYRTPIIVSAILLVAISIYASIKEINVITHISFILMFLGLILFTLSSTSLITEINLDNLLPILKTSPIDILTSSIKLAIINTLPIITILIIPKDKITNKEKYNKAMIITYIIGSIISFITTIGTISTLGIYLTNIFTYPEYIVLKKIKLFGFLERIENIIAIKWIIESFIYITILIYTISKSITRKNEKTFIYMNIIIGIILILSTKYLFKNIVIFNKFIQTTFIYIVSILIIIYLIICTKLYIKKCQIAKHT